MSQFDFKKAYVRLKDGTSHAGAVDHGAGYTAGALTMAVDAFAVEIQNNRTFTVVGSTKTYTITGHTPSSGATTALTFTPALDATIADNAIITVGPNRMDIRTGDGNLTWSEKKNREYSKDRGVLDTVRDGDEEPVDVKLDFQWEMLRATTGSEQPTVEDVLKNRGEASGWLTSATDPCEPFALDLEIEYVPACGGEEREIILFEDFRYEDLSHDSKQGQISISGKANITEPTVSRVA